MKRLLTIVLIAFSITATAQTTNDIKTYTAGISKMQYFSQQVLDRIAIRLVDAVVNKEINPYRNDSLASQYSETGLMDRLRSFLGIEYRDSTTPFSVDSLKSRIEGVWFSYKFENTPNGITIILNSIGVSSIRNIAGIQLGEEPMFQVSREQLKQLVTPREFEWLNYFANFYILQTGGTKRNSHFYYPLKTSYIELFWGDLYTEVKDTLTFSYSTEYEIALEALIEDKLNGVIKGCPEMYLDSMLVNNVQLKDSIEPLFIKDTFITSIDFGDTLIETSIINTHRGGRIYEIKFYQKNGELYSMGFSILHNAFNRERLNYQIKSGTVWVKPSDIEKHLSREQFNFLLMLFQELKRSNNEPFKPLLDVEY